MTPYTELLKDPRWQRKRLERLEVASFECENCGDGTKTLHVHHPRYIRGRKPWEYGNDELEVLCEDCHKEHHAAMEVMNRLLVSPDGPYLMSVCAGWLSIGFDIDYDDEVTLTKVGDPMALACGMVAKLLEAGSRETMEKVVGIIREGFEGRIFSPVEQSLFDTFAR